MLEGLILVRMVAMKCSVGSCEFGKVDFVRRNRMIGEKCSVGRSDLGKDAFVLRKEDGSNEVFCRKL